MLYNRVRVITNSTGTGDLSLEPAVDGFQDFPSAGVLNGDAVRYVIESGYEWEIGKGTYNALSNTLSRDEIVETSNSDNSILNIADPAYVFVTAVAEDIISLQDVTDEIESEKGSVNGIASLDSSGKVPSAQLPSYVDDVLEYANYASLPATGETGKIYITIDDSSSYRWSGSEYIEISSGSSSSTWGSIGGTLTDQTDLNNVLNEKVPYTGATDDVSLGSNNLITNSVFSNGINLNTASPLADIIPGQLRWNVEDLTPEVVLNTDVTLQIGQESLITVSNRTGATIANGTLVRVVGTVGNSGKALIAPAVCDSSYQNDIQYSSKYILGITTHDILNDGDGYIAYFGKIRGVDTTGGAEAWSDGDTLYGDPLNPGGITNVKPESPNLKLPVGMVVNAHSNGTLFVRVFSGSDMDDLHDVKNSSKIDGDILRWNEAEGYWDHVQDLTNIENGIITIKGDGWTNETIKGNADNIQLNTDHRNISTGNPHSVTKSDVNLGNVPNLDFSNASNITTGTLSSSLLPPIAITTPHVVDSELEQISLSVQEGDIAIRTDLSKSYIYNGGSTGTMTDWNELMTPTDAVLSVNGSTGTVVLNQDDIGDGSTYVQTHNDFTDTLLSKLNGVDNNANNYSLPLATASSRGGAQIGYIENGKNYPVELSSEKMFVNVPWVDTTYTSSDFNHNSLINTHNLTTDLFPVWNNITSTPTTLIGYGITDYYTDSDAVNAVNAETLLSVNISGSSASLTTSRTLTIGGTGKGFDGSSDISWSLAEIGVDPAGTDNSVEVTLAGSYDYLTILGQEITLNQIDWNTDITNIPSSFTPSTHNHDNLYYTETEIDSALTGKENVSNKVSSFQVTPDDSHYPTEKLVKDNLDTVTGDIDTINGAIDAVGSVLYKIEENAEDATFTPGTSDLTSTDINSAIIEVNTKIGDINTVLESI